MKALISLLEEFEKLPRIQERYTFMEIAGFSSKEIASSNILSFFFNSQEVHNLNNLCVNSLLNCVRYDFRGKDTSTINVHREVQTSTGKRIDLLVECVDLIIVIENKIFASLYNDLNDYSNYADEKYPNKPNVKIILSLRNSDEELSSGFFQTTHIELLEEIEKNLMCETVYPDEKYLIYLLDYKQTIQNLIKPNSMNREMLELFGRKRDVILEFQAEKEKIDSFIYRKIDRLRGLVKFKNLGYPVNQWVYRKKYALVHDIKMKNGVIIAVDCELKYNGIEVRVWVRKGNVNKKEYLKSLDVYSDKYEVDEEKIVVLKGNELDLLTPDDQIAERLSMILKKI